MVNSKKLVVTIDILSAERVLLTCISDVFSAFVSLLPLQRRHRPRPPPRGSPHPAAVASTAWALAKLRLTPPEAAKGGSGLEGRWVGLVGLVGGCMLGVWF